MRNQTFLVALGLILVNSGLSMAQQSVVLTAPGAVFVPANPAEATLPYDGLCSGCADNSCASDWTGLYLGLHGGWGFSRVKRDLDVDESLADAISDAEIENRANGGILGVHAGFNFEMRRLVFGIEGDFDATGIDRERTAVRPSPIDPARFNSFTAEDQITWLASLRGRVGFTGGKSLFYLTGGIAWQGIEREATLDVVTGPGPSSVFEGTTISGNRPGYTLGAGMEHKFSENWSLRGEYRFYQFDRSNTDNLNFATAIGEAAAALRSGNNNVHTFLLGLTYHF